MSDRLTDKKVSIMAEVDPRWDGTKLAREVQEYRALRPTCPTCKGKGWVVVGQTYGSPQGEQGQCDCEDGRMPLAEWVALLVSTLRTVHGALDLTGMWLVWALSVDASEQASASRLRRLAQVDAVLKMAGKS